MLATMGFWRSISREVSPSLGGLLDYGHFDSRCGSKAKVVKEGVASRERKIKQQEAARQTRENTMRIAQNV